MNTKTREYARASGFAASQLIDPSGPLKSPETLAKAAKLPKGNGSSGRASVPARTAHRQERAAVEKPKFISPRMLHLYARMNQV